MSLLAETMLFQRISSLSYAALHTGKKCKVTYVWLDEQLNPISQTRTMDFVPTKCEDIPQLNTSYVVEEGCEKEMAADLNVVPVKMFRDPFALDPHKLVLCEAYRAPGVPFGSSHRITCAKVMENVKEKKPWFGVEQEYILYGNNGLPFGWPCNEDWPVPYASACVGLQKAFGRDVCLSHYQACLYAGLKIFGITGEAVASQWEFQIGPCEGVDAADQVWMARYILNRVCEDFGVVACLDPKPIPRIRGASGGHVNFSTEDMRSEGGIKYIEDAIQKLSLCHLEHMRIYDPSGGAENQKRLIGQGALSSYSHFTWELGKRSGSVRIPGHVSQSGCGYFEDRRPPANCDPYTVCQALVETCLLSENHSNENMK